jgi:hypothetical protein
MKVLSENVTSIPRSGIREIMGVPASLMSFISKSAERISGAEAYR